MWLSNFEYFLALGMALILGLLLGFIIGWDYREAKAEKYEKWLRGDSHGTKKK